MTLYMYWPQVVWAVLVLLKLGIELALHGQARTSKHSFWGQLFRSATVAWLLWCGGFFSQARAAQPPQTSLQYRADVIRNARLEWGMSAPVADFAAQLHQEGGWRANAVSPLGAQGMAQFMPATADWISQRVPGLNSREPFNPAWAIRALVSYDRWLWQRVSAVDDCERMAMTLSAYNGGLGWVQRDRRLAESQGVDGSRWFDSIERVNAGRSMSAWRENRHYPRRILKALAPRYLTWGGASCV
ncbi:Membrane-bound lytic murein transglycosylase F [Arsenophonus nasoniae]|nr:Membrane-bound lytic murein transglycosylase F [Arsenophonus nasoniae]